ncbi:MAG: T9SS type A sorting domain-containing protein [Ignavibacteriales bacterium]|nr:T9SS type A sorting domain-containing protein [Ignavibacteriales bacterium]
MRTLVIIIFAAVFIIPCAMFGQNELTLEPFITSNKYLDDQIRGDTTATGQRVNPARVYVLKRNGLYFSRAVQNTGYALRIRAAYGTGAKPIVNAFRTGAGTYAAQIFQVDTLLWLKNLSLNGWDEGGEAFSVYQSRIINVNRLGSSVYVDSCTLNGSTATLIQTSVATRYVRVTNSVFANAGNVRANNLGNGRAIDFRNVSIDSAYIENNSFFNMSDRVFRHFGAGQVPLRNIVINHNTVFNELAEHGGMGLGMVGGVVRITNNLLVDNFIFGNDSTATERLGEFGDTGERGPSGAYRMTLVGTIPANDTIAAANYSIKNNFYSVSPSLQAFYDSRNGLSDAGIGNLIPLTWYINKQLGADSVNAFTKVTTPVVFTKALPTAVSMAEWFYKPIAEGGSGKIKQNATFDPKYDWERKETLFLTDTLNFAYPTSSAAYTGGAGGYPVGDLNWFPTRKAQWQADPATSVNVPDGAIPVEFALHQNYPNPFNPTTTISFLLPQSGNVVLKVVNMLGQEVTTLVNEKRDAGTHSVTFDASSLTSGVYFYTLTSQNFVAARKMLLIK